MAVRLWMDKYEFLETGLNMLIMGFRNITPRIGIC